MCSSFEFRSHFDKSDNFKIGEPWKKMQVGLHDCQSEKISLEPNFGSQVSLTLSLQKFYLSIILEMEVALKTALRVSSQ